MNGKVPWSLTVVLSLIISTVRGQCTNGNEAECVWSHEENAPLRWISKTDGGSENWVEVTGCVPPSCGTAVLQSPWLPPTQRETSWMLRYKIYGHKDVELQLSLRTEDSGPRQLFFKRGNYAHGFPEFWSATKVVLPATQKRHRLLLEAITTFESAFVAVSDIRMEVELTSRTLPDETVPRTTTVPTASRTHQEAIEPETRTVEPTSRIQAAPLTPDTQTDSDDEDQNEENQSEDHLGALEAGFVGGHPNLRKGYTIDHLGALEAGFVGGHPNLRKGYTIVMDPNICKYP